ncbi:MAG: hypothetical protein HYY23_08645 [Verrucomicrobia bacterium]|nr:hypothetical protein [Verrucomicrobiota bacterium]
MKTKILLVLSLALNAVLLAMWARHSNPQRVDEPPAAEVRIVTNTVVRKAPASSRTVAQPTVLPMDWRSIESADYRTYIQNLRKAGCPEETIRDIIIADVNKLYASRWRAAHPADPNWKYWEAEGKSGKEERQRKQERAALEQEKRALIRELLGIDLEQETRSYALDSGFDKQERALSFLSVEKQNQIRELQARFKAASAAISPAEGTGKESKVEMQRRMAGLEKQYQAELRQILTPSELEDYELRSSSLASKLRNELSAFEPSEQEFKQLFKLYQGLEEQRASFPGKWTEEQQDLAQRQVKEQARQLLGDARFDEFQRARSEEYLDAVRTAEKMELPKDAVDQMYQINVALREQVEAVRANPNLNERERDALVRNIKEERQRALAEFAQAKQGRTKR